MADTNFLASQSRVGNMVVFSVVPKVTISLMGEVAPRDAGQEPDERLQKAQDKLVL